MKYFSLPFCILILFCSCKKNEQDNDSQQYEFLKNEFHGTYRLISSTSKVSVDINMDGISSTNLLNELSRINESKINIKVLKRPNFTPAFNSYFDQPWPEQYFTKKSESIDNVTVYDPAVDVTYLLQPTSANCDFKISDKLLSIENNGLSTSSRTLTLPVLVSYSGQADEREITTVTNKAFYTSKGMVNTQVTSVYRRGSL